MRTGSVLVLCAASLEAAPQWEDIPPASQEKEKCFPAHVWVNSTNISVPTTCQSLLGFPNTVLNGKLWSLSLLEFQIQWNIGSFLNDHINK